MDSDLSISASKPYECEICDKSYTKKRGLAQHMITHSKVRPFSCSVCDKAFYFKDRLANHLLIHKNIRKHSCNVCNKSFTKSYILKKHMLIHRRDRLSKTGGGPFDCNSCGKTFLRQLDLDYHMTTHDVACSFCKKKFTFKQDLLLHIKSDHKCHVCKETFAKRGHLVRHMAVHDTKGFPCSVCDKVYGYKKHLSRHLLTHKNYSFSCSICDKVYSYKNGLSRHLLTHKNYQLESSGPFSCCVCGKDFSSSNTLKQHKQVHWKTSLSTSEVEGNLCDKYESEEEEDKKSSPQIVEEKVGDSKTLRMQEEKDSSLARHSHKDNPSQLFEKKKGPSSSRHLCKDDHGTLKLQKKMEEPSSGLCSVEDDIDSPVQEKRSEQCTSSLFQRDNDKQVLEEDSSRNQLQTDMKTLVPKLSGGTLVQEEQCITHLQEIDTNVVMLVVEGNEDSCKLQRDDFTTFMPLEIQKPKDGTVIFVKKEESYTSHPLQEGHTKDSLHIPENDEEMCASEQAQGNSLKEFSEIQDSHTRPYACEICEKSYSKRKSLLRHMVIHGGFKPFACDSCDKTFFYKHHLTEHMMIHQNIRSFSCDICGKSYNGRSSLRAHMFTHNIGNFLSCSTCSKKFRTPERLEHHMRQHNAICEVCDEIFPHKKDLSMHRNSVHLGRKCKKCPICGKLFAPKTSMAKHLHRHVKKGEMIVKNQPQQNSVKSLPRTLNKKEDISTKTRVKKNFMKAPARIVKIKVSTQQNDYPEMVLVNPEMKMEALPRDQVQSDEMKTISQSLNETVKTSTIGQQHTDQVETLKESHEKRVINTIDQLHNDQIETLPQGNEKSVLTYTEDQQHSDQVKILQPTHEIACTEDQQPSDEENVSQQSHEKRVRTCTEDQQPIDEENVLQQSHEKRVRTCTEDQQPSDEGKTSPQSPKKKRRTSTRDQVKNKKWKTTSQIHEEKVNMHPEEQPQKDKEKKKAASDKSHMCIVCLRGFFRKYNLLWHMLKHKDSLPFPCNFCNKSISSKEVLTKHLLLHRKKSRSLDSDSKIHRKKSCSSDSDNKIHTKKAALNQRLSQGKDHETYLCNICKKAFSCKRYLNRHIRRLHESSHACNVCDENFDNVRELGLHDKSVHLGVSCPECPVCGKVFTNNYNVNKHLQIHIKKGEASTDDFLTTPRRKASSTHLCSMCGKSLGSLDSLKSHLLRHEANSCDECGKNFPHKNDLVVHQRSVHLGLVCPECPLCRKAFTRKAHLNSHLHTHVKNGELSTKELNQLQVEKINDETSQDHESSDLRCSDCGDILPNDKETLIDHFRTHNPSLSDSSRINEKGSKKRKGLPRKIEAKQESEERTGEREGSYASSWKNGHSNSGKSRLLSSPSVVKKKMECDSKSVKVNMSRRKKNDSYLVIGEIYRQLSRDKQKSNCDSKLVRTKLSRKRNDSNVVKREMCRNSDDSDLDSHEVEIDREKEELDMYSEDLDIDDDVKSVDVVKEELDMYSEDSDIDDDAIVDIMN